MKQVIACSIKDFQHKVRQALVYSITDLGQGEISGGMQYHKRGAMLNNNLCAVLQI